MIEKVLIVGLGSIGKRHLDISKKLLPHSIFGALRSGKTQASQNPSLDFSTYNLEEALSFKPNIAVLSNPAPRHIELGIELAKRGVHLLIEKPISNTLDWISEFCDIVEKNNIIVSVGYNLKFSSSLIFLKKTIEEGKIGKVLAVQASVGQYLPDWRPDQNYRSSVSANRNLGGGALLELSHEINYISWLFGRIESLVCITGKSSNLEIDVEDFANLLMMIDQKDLKHLCISLRLDLVRRDPHRSCTIIGESGTLLWDFLSGQVKYYDGEKKVWVTLYSQDPDRNETYIAEWTDFLNAIQNQKKPMTSYQEAIETLKVVEAAKISNGNLIRLID